MWSNALQEDTNNVEQLQMALILSISIPLILYSHSCLYLVNFLDGQINEGNLFYSSFWSDSYFVFYRMLLFIFVVEPETVNSSKVRR